MEKPRKIVEFSRNSFLNLLPHEPFSRSFSVVFSRFCGRFAVIPGENQRISEKIREFRRNLSIFFPFLSTSLHFLSPNHPILCSKMLNLTMHNKKVIFLFGRT
nr:MAG TPA: hypothetical protein [Caudoviricetes sp.]